MKKNATKPDTTPPYVFADSGIRWYQLQSDVQACLADGLRVGKEKQLRTQDAEARFDALPENDRERYKRMSEEVISESSINMRRSGLNGTLVPQDYDPESLPKYRRARRVTFGSRKKKGSAKWIPESVSFVPDEATAERLYGRERLQHNRKHSSKAAKATGNHTDDEIVKAFKVYKSRHDIEGKPVPGINQVVEWIITKHEKHPREYLEYAYPESLYKRLGKIAKSDGYTGRGMCDKWLKSL